MSIAFCFLTYDEVTRQDIWEKYFENVDNNKYTIHVHPKFQKEIKSQKLFNDKIIPTICETIWGGFSIIAAQHLLFTEALKNQSTMYAILVSHNTIPVQSFDKFYKYICSLQNLSVFDVDLPNKNQISRYDTLNMPNFPKSVFLFQSQWCILSRQDMACVVNDFEKITDIFDDSAIPDEHTYVNYLVHYKHKCFVKCQTTYSTRIDTMYAKYLNNHNKIYQNNVQVHYHLSNDFISCLKKSNVFFLRKIAENSELDINFLLDIKKNDD